MKKSKKRLFYLITVSIPFVFFLLLEVVLRISNYGEQPPVFISDVAASEYLIFNPKVSERYFAQKEFSTQGQYDVFLKEKSPNTVRIFVQGASTSAGFPYNHSGSFPRLLEQKLQHQYSDRNIEVINTSLAATNSFTLLDLSDEIIEQKPDMVIIYGGHNEYYGALGVGSSQSFGKSTAATNFYLRLKNVRIVQLMKNIVKGIYSVRIQEDDQQTLMAKMVKNESIPFDSDLYHRGIDQYKTNITALLTKYKEAGIPVYICTLVSNLRDFEPFESAEDSEYNAEEAFKQGRSILDTDSLGAKAKLSDARDFDLLKFRAPSAIEQAVVEIAQELNVPVIDTHDAFEKNSDEAIIGNELLLEHVHANLNGQRLFAETIYNSVSELLTQKGIRERPLAEEFDYITAEVDSLYGTTLLKQLLNNWPFTDNATSPSAPTNDIERLIIGETPWVAVMNSKYVEQIQSEPAKALRTAKVLMQEYPHQTQPYIMVGESYNKMGDYEKAEIFLSRVPKNLATLDVYKVRLTNLIDMKNYRGAIPIARVIQQTEATLPNQYTLQALSDISAVNWTDLNTQAIQAEPDKHVKALGALFYLKRTEEVNTLYQKLKVALPDNEELKRLANTIQLK
ncbi:SGNH/GDSL hydrolase family protein [Roseivirga sp.]|uniref:SGNH/GDSL hydrolase family protein n=1 Tax=Roseivirga sp. TaxID=1964215 RepID=UPI003B527C6D